MTREKKQSCVLFRTVVEAAKEMNKDDALELLLTYADYAMGDTDDVETDNKYVKLILKQLVPALSAAEKRYEAAVENGKKGAEQGREKGGGVGRPRKGESQEDYQKRVKEWKETPSKTPQKPPINTNQKPPENPLDVDVDVYVDTEVDKESISKDNISKEDRYKNLTWEEYLKLFINKHPSFNYNLDNSIFVCTYTDILDRYKQFIKDKTSMDIPIPVLAREVMYYATFGRVYAGEEVTRPA